MRRRGGSCCRGSSCRNRRRLRRRQRSNGQEQALFVHLERTNERPAIPTVLPHRAESVAAEIVRHGVRGHRALHRRERTVPNRFVVTDLGRLRSWDAFRASPCDACTVRDVLPLSVRSVVLTSDRKRIEVNYRLQLSTRTWIWWGLIRVLTKRICATRAPATRLGIIRHYTEDRRATPRALAYALGANAIDIRRVGTALDRNS